jgi:HlyD family secretion protein
MEVGVMLSEVDHGRIAVGMAARCVLDTYPDRVFQGRVEEVRAVAAEARRGFGPAGSPTGFPVRIALAASDPLMRPGLSVRVEVVRKVWPHVLAVPRQAVRFEKGQGFVTLKEGTAPAPVQLEGCTPVDCVVQSGLSEGDHVFF